MPRARVRPGRTHRSRTAKGGDVIDVTEAELESFGDKLERLSELPVGDLSPDDPGTPETLSGVFALIAATGAARRLAIEKGADLALVTPTGAGGKIIKRDIVAYLGEISW